MDNQKQVWNNIAKEWHARKKIPSKLSKSFIKKTNGKVLDFGSGSGRHLSKIKNGEMYLVDFSKEMLKLAQKKAKIKKIRAKFEQGNLTKLKFENNFFDFGIAISTLHCLKPLQQKKAIKELYRVLKPKGKILIGVWNFNSKRFNQKRGKEKLIGWTDKGKRYYYLFDEKEIHTHFKKVGFKIISSHNSEMMINFIVQK